MKLYFILSLFFFINYSFATNSNIYAFTSQLDTSIGQYFFIIDASYNQITQNTTLYLPCSISGVLSVNDTNALLLCQEGVSSVEQYYLTSININDGTYQNIKSIQESEISFYGQTTQLVYFNNVVHLPGVVNTNPKNVSLYNIDFESNTINYNIFSSIKYKYENGLPIGGFDYNNEIMYILYPSEHKNATSTTFPSNFIAYNINDIKGTQKFFNSIQNIRNEYTQLLFCGPQGQLYSVNGNPDTSSFDICQVDFQQLTCPIVLSVPVQEQSKSFEFLEWYISGSKQQIIFTSNINNNTQLLFDIYDISDFSHSQLSITNIWPALSNDYTFTYFYLQ